MDNKTKVQIINDRTVNELSYRNLGNKYGMPLSSLYKMINSNQEHHRDQEAALAAEDKSLPDDVKTLKEELRRERLKNELLNSVIDIASKELGVDIRKKSGTRRS